MVASDLRTCGIVHVHSVYSHDGVDTLEHLAAVCQDRGIAFVGLTDHAEDFTADIFDEYTRECQAVSGSGVRLIPGLEFRFPGFPGLHLLALGLRTFIQPTTPDEFVRLAREASRFTIVAHPILPHYTIPQDVAAGIDAIEVWNAAYNTRYLPDTRAVRLYHELRARHPHLVAVAGLDQHDAANDRGTRILLEHPSDDPLGQLREGQFRNRGVTLEFGPHAEWGPLALAGLSGLRALLDMANAAHERLAHARARLRRSR